MPRILLVKTSSLGDVVHNLPVVGDVQRHLPEAQIDWVVEAAFADIPRLHPAVHQVLPVQLRRWRRALLRSRPEICAFRAALCQHEYDAIIDTQGLLKSAVVARSARGVCHGLDWQSSREPLRPLYDHTHRVPWDRHAVERNRSLAALALGYTLDAPARYGIAAPRRTLSWLPAGRYAVLLHATSADAKLWPESSWHELHNYMFSKDLFSVLPWGNHAEQARSTRLAAAMGNAVVPEQLGLDDVAVLLAGAQCVVGVDTGLTHLAVALDVPTVGIYCATDPAATGLHGGARAMHVGNIGAPPTVREVIAAIEQVCAA